jgi:hypothetical protein
VCQRQFHGGGYTIAPLHFSGCYICTTVDTTQEQTAAAKAMAQQSAQQAHAQT